MRFADRSKPRVREGLPASLELSEAGTVVSREKVPYNYCDSTDTHDL